VDEQQIDLIDAEAIEAALRGAHHVVGGELFGRDLGGQEQLLALDAAGPDTRADLALVAIADRRVDVTVSAGERRLDGLDARVAGQHPGAEADRGNDRAMSPDERRH